jgi:protease-4
MIGKIFGGIFRGLDILRKFLHLVLLLVIFGIVVGALRTSIPHVEDHSALVIQPRGEIVEQLTGSPVDRALARAQGNAQRETLLWDLIDVLKAAKRDARISAVVLDLNYLLGGGQPTLAEFAAAIRDFRSSGKKVVAHSAAYLQESYYVAAAADEVYLDPLGLVGIDGYERYRTYYKDLFEKLGVEVNLFRVGAYKSAGEVYVRNDMSAEDKEESLAYLNGLWLNYRTAVAEARGLDPEDISRYVANLVPAMQAASSNAWRCWSGLLPARRTSTRSKPVKVTPASRTTPRRSTTTFAWCTPRRPRAPWAGSASASSSPRVRFSTARSHPEQWVAKPRPS